VKTLYKIFACYGNADNGGFPPAKFEGFRSDFVFFNDKNQHIDILVDLWRFGGIWRLKST